MHSWTEGWSIEAKKGSKKQEHDHERVLWRAKGVEKVE